MKKLYIIGVAALFMASCRPSVNITTPPTAGNADFRSYLAIGNSLTAGYADGSLYVTGQVNSYPQRLYEQFTLVTSVVGARTSFIQPYLHGDNGYGNSDAGTPNSRPRKVLSWVKGCTGDISLAPVNLPTWGADPLDAAPFVSPGPNGQVNNIGVPGIRVADYPVNGYGAMNPYAARFYKDATKSPMDELIYRVNNLQPTFFTLWLGSNDVLGYALAGGQGDGSGNATPVMANYYNSIDITPTSVFKNEYERAVAVAISKGAQGALINIPDVERLPFFTAIPSNGLYIKTQAEADMLTAQYASYNYIFHLGYNQFIIRDNAGLVRQSVPGELILMTCPMDSITCAGWGSTKAIPQEFVLTTVELQNIRTYTVIYNNHIRDMAKRYNLAYVDINTYMKTLSSGMVYDGITYNTKFIAGGAFSLDGVHPNGRGYALVANKIIETINAFYKSTVPQMDANKFPGVLFP